MRSGKRRVKPKIMLRTSPGSFSNRDCTGLGMIALEYKLRDLKGSEINSAVV